MSDAVADGATGDGPEDGPEAGPPEVHGHPVVISHGQEVVCCGRDGYLELMTALKGDGFEVCIDVCGVDYLTHVGRDLAEGVVPERFEVVVNLLSHRDRRRIRVRVQVPESDPMVPTLFDLWPGSEALERETFDMYGIRFDGHPDPTRILMPEDWEGHPLRKDYSVGRIPVQFKETPPAR